MIGTVSNEYWINSIRETPDGFECPRCNNVWEHRSEAIECIVMHSRYVYAVEREKRKDAESRTDDN